MSSPTVQCQSPLCQATMKGSMVRSPSPLAEATCVTGDFLSVLAWSGADTSFNYELRIGSADGPLSLYPPANAAGLASGWYLSSSNFPGVPTNGPFTVVIVRAGTNIGVAQATLEMQNGWPRCLS